MYKKILGLFILMILCMGVAYASFTPDYYETIKMGETLTKVSTDYGIANVYSTNSDKPLVLTASNTATDVTFTPVSPGVAIVSIIQMMPQVTKNVQVTVLPQFLFAKEANAVISTTFLPYVKSNDSNPYPKYTAFEDVAMDENDSIELNSTYSTSFSKYFNVKDTEGNIPVGFIDINDSITYNYYFSVSKIEPQVEINAGSTIDGDLKDAIDGVTDNFGNEIDVADSTINMYVPDDYKSEQGEDEVLSKPGIFSLIVKKIPNQGDVSTYIFTVKVKEFTPITKINTYEWYSNNLGSTVDPIEQEIYTVNEGADPKAVTIESSNPNIAKITEDGKIKATGIGNCTITITANDDPTVSTSFTWYTYADWVAGNGETYSGVMTKYLDDNGDDINEFNNIISNSNPDILDAEITGPNEITFKGKGEGFATIKIDQYQQPGVYRYITVQCVNSLVPACINQEVKVSKELISSTPCFWGGMPFGEILKEAWVSDPNGNKTQATIENNTIKFTPIITGPYVLYAYNEYDSEFAYYIYVENYIPVTSVQLDQTKVIINKGENLKLNATVLPENATNKKVTWKSSDPSIATVDQYGNVIGIQKGKVKITCKSVDNPSAKATCSLEVYVPVESVILNEHNIEVLNGTKIDLIATVNPEDATNKTVKWSSTKKSVATVDKTGLVQTKNIGETYVYCISKADPTKLDICRIFSYIKLDIVSTNNKTISKVNLKKGRSTKVVADIKGLDYGKGVTWKSSNKNIARVDANGVITGIKAGKVKITATSKYDKTKSATIDVTVYNK